MVTVETPSSYAKSVKDAVKRACFDRNFPFDIAWAVCQTEVGANLATGEPVQGIGNSGEIGIMQVTPPAMMDISFFIDETSDLDDQAQAGVRYLQLLSERFGLGDDMIRAYNVGPDTAARDQLAGRDYLATVRSFL